MERCLNNNRFSQRLLLSVIMDNLRSAISEQTQYLDTIIAPWGRLEKKGLTARDLQI